MVGTTDLPSSVHCSNHPLLQHKLTLLRDKRTTARDFRHLLRELTLYLGYEATTHLEVEPRTIQTQYGPFTGNKLSERIAIVPILRGGLGMIDAMSEVLPNSAIYHIGMYRNRKSSLPIQYYNRLPKGRASDATFVLDPIIATSGTVSATCAILKKWGTKKVVVIGVIASTQGIHALLQAHPDVTIHVAAIDDTMNEEGHVIPGIGDAGERLFNASLGEEDEDDNVSQATAGKHGSKKLKMG